MPTTPQQSNATDLRAVYDSDGILAIVHNSDGTGAGIVETAIPQASLAELDTALARLGCQRHGDWRTPDGATPEIGCYVEDVDPLRLLHAAFAAARDDDATSSDFVDWLDDYLTARGYPTVLYA